VVVTQGTLASDDLSQLIEPALIGLAGLDVTVVAALGAADPAALSFEVPANATWGPRHPPRRPSPRSSSTSRSSRMWSAWRR